MIRCGLIWASLVLFVSSGALAERRIAVVIGNNNGTTAETPLRFAERDARRVARTLKTVGDVADDDVRLILSPNRRTVLTTLHALRATVANAKEDVLLVVYYSGHASVGHLHLSGTRLPFQEFIDAARNTGAKATVVLVDACRSGGLTQVKGGVSSEPFEIRADDQLETSGLAIITSAAAGEDAQESERLSGGIFTHHVVVGLRGAADTSRDGRVTLEELYRYTAFQTLRTTSRTRFLQHPSYSFRLSGRNALILSTPRREGVGGLTFTEPGRWVVLDERARGEVTAEVRVDDAEARVLLPAGPYLVRQRGRDAVFEGRTEVTADGETRLTTAQLSPVPYPRTVRRGLSDRETVWSLGLQAEVGGQILADSPGLYGAIGAQIDWKYLSAQFRFRYGRATSERNDFTLTQDMYGGDISLMHVFDVERARLGIGLGVRVGVDGFIQTTDGPVRRQAVGRAGPILQLDFDLTHGLALWVAGGGDTYIYSRDTTTGSEIEARFVPYGSLGLAVRIP